MFQGRTTVPNFLVLNTDFLPGKTWDLQNISYLVVQDWMLPPINPMLQPLLQILPFVGVTGETSSAGCTLLASLLCSYTPDIWSCFCAWNINIGPWRKWLLNTAWEKCSWEHCKYHHFPIYNMHSRAMQCKVMSVCMCVCVWEGAWVVYAKTDNRRRISVCIRIHGTIKKLLTYTSTPPQTMPVWITRDVLLQSILSSSLGLGCHPFVISQKQWDTS